MPYEVGRFRDEWTRYPVLVRQYHPDLNGGIVLSQIPPAADVWLLWQCDSGHLFIATPEEQRSRPGRTRRQSAWCPECSAKAGPASGGKRKRNVCDKTPSLATGDAFASVCAPRPASVVESELRAGLLDRLEFDPAHNAVKVARPFFDHVEVWPDLVLADLRVAIEYDSTGRHGLEHVGRREHVDRRKDRALRHAGWEVVRIRTGKLHELGPHDIVTSGVTGRLFDRLLDRLRELRGELLVEAYRRR